MLSICVMFAMRIFKKLRLYVLTGKSVIKQYLRNLDNLPGVYRMCDARGKVIYVGKAKDLKKRVASYALSNNSKLSIRIANMIAKVASMDFITANSEEEALIIEADLIKQFNPKYNIMFRDDKSYAFIQLTLDHKFPAVIKIRRNQHQPLIKGMHGPFVSGKILDQTIKCITSAFKIRSCSDSYFASRKKPCLQYYIKRCSAPCVNLIKKEEYDISMKNTNEFLRGGSKKLIDKFQHLMTQASKDWHYEKAIMYRDYLQSLENFNKNFSNSCLKSLPGLIHVLAVASNGNKTCLQQFVYFNGYSRGNKVFFQNFAEDDSNMIVEFIKSFYTNSQNLPNLILTSHAVPIDELKVLQKAVEISKHNMRDEKDKYKKNKPQILKVECPKIGNKKRLVDEALSNAKTCLNRVKVINFQKGLDLMMRHFGMKTTIQRVEVYDNSHTFGASAKGAFIALNSNGFIKKDYRAFNITNSAIVANKNDDYAMLRYTLLKRINQAKDNNKTQLQDLPEIMVIDGGKGHLKVAYEVLKMEKLQDKIFLIAMAKGEYRNKGEETIFTTEKTPYKLDQNLELAYFMQAIRDEAHNFAISSHRRKRDKSMTQSLFDDMPKIGPKRKKILLQNFQTIQGIKNATAQEINKKTNIPMSVIESLLTYLQDN